MSAPFQTLRIHARRLVIASAGCTLLLCTGCYSMNGYMMNASGKSFYERGNYAMAAQEFQQAIQSNPKNPDYLSNLAKARTKMGDYHGAEQLYQQAIVQNPSHQPAYHGYAELMLAQNRPQDALRMMNTWAATQPYIAESHVELAWLQRELGQHDQAAQSLETALQVNPEHSIALAHLGQYHQERGDSGTAVSYYQQSLRADWNQPHVHSRLAMAADSAGNGHPMSRMAMSRGVHPHAVAQADNGYQGPPPFARPLNAPQMAFQPQPHSALHTMALSPQNLSPRTPKGLMPPFPDNSSNPTMDFANVPSMTITPDSGNEFPLETDGSEFITPSPMTMPNPSPRTATGPAPVPDPAFSLNHGPQLPANTQMPVTSVSHPRPAEIADGAFPSFDSDSETQLPEVEAF